MNGKEILAFKESDEAIGILIKDDTVKLVMHKAENGLMCEMASLACKNGGDILEIGFGLGLSASEVQKNKNVTSHTIIEVHPDIFDRAIKKWKPYKKTNIIQSDWWDLLPLKDKKFDGIIHDTHNDDKIHLFLDKVTPNCKIGTIVVFFEYPREDERIGIWEYIDLNNEWDSLPYKEYRSFFNNRFELKYSIWDGNKWSDENINLDNSK